MHPFNAFGSETANERTVQCWFETFCRGDESLEVEERSGWLLEIDNDQLRATIRSAPLTTTQEVAKERKANHFTVSGIWTKLERWKSSITGCPWTDWKKTQKLLFWSIGFSYSMQQQWTISWSHCDLRGKVGCIRQPVTISWVVGPSSSSQALPKVKPASQKGHAHCWVVCCGSDPLQPSESKWTHYVWEICSALTRCTENCNACGQHWSTERAQFILHDSSWLHVAQPMLQKLNELGYKVLSHPPFSLTSHQPTTTSSSISMLFRENAFTASRTQKILS